VKRPRKPPPARSSSVIASFLRVHTRLDTHGRTVLPYDGLDPQPPTYCFLKPHYLNVQTSYFEHVRNGTL
jgi:hypothetical protein